MYLHDNRAWLHSKENSCGWLSFRNGGSHFPEHWLSLTGTVAQFGPEYSNVTEEKESELEEFIDYAKIVMGTFGHRIFEPVVDIPPEPSVVPVDADVEPMLYLKTTKANARGRRTNEGFVVFKDSTVSTIPTKSCPDTILHLRKLYAEKITNDVLTEDTLFKSPSAAVFGK